MKRTLLSLVFVMWMGAVFCQNKNHQKPNYDLIKKEIQDSSSVFFYPRLMDRMVSLDSTLNKDDYRHLYYGFLYHKDFEPFMTNFNEDKLVGLYKRKDLKDIDYDKIIALASRSIATFPFELRSLHVLCNSYKFRGNLDLARKLNKRYFDILEAIYSTGDGRSKETAIHVISVRDEYEILRQNDLQLITQTKDGDCDCLKIYNGLRLQGRTINLYFYTGQIDNKELQNL